MQVCFWHEYWSGRCVCCYNVIMTIITTQVKAGVQEARTERKAIILLPGYKFTTGCSGPETYIESKCTFIQRERDRHTRGELTQKKKKEGERCRNRNPHKLTCCRFKFSSKWALQMVSVLKRNAHYRYPLFCRVQVRSPGYNFGT